MVLFDTTSLMFYGAGGESFGRHGKSKDHRPDLRQVIVGVVLDADGRPICSETWPGNATDVKALLPVVARLRERFGIVRMCVVADRGVISAETIGTLEAHGIARSFAAPGCAKAAICCVPIWPRKTRPRCGITTSGWSRWSRRSRLLKGDLAIRPVFHQREARIAAHIFIAFLAYSLHATPRQRLGLTPRAVLEAFAAVQMIDVHIPTTDGRELLLTRHTELDPALRLLIDKLKLQLPAQPPPRITAAQPPTPV